MICEVIYTRIHTRLTALCPGLPGWASTRKVKPIWILLKLETVSGSSISWAICKSAPRSRQITLPAPHPSVFYRPGALPVAQPTASKHWSCRLIVYVHKLLTNNVFVIAANTAVKVRKYCATSVCIRPASGFYLPAVCLWCDILLYSVLWQWDPDRLKADTLFVMGSRANKSVTWFMLANILAQ